MATDSRTTELALGLKDRGRALTDDEFAEGLYDEPWRYELVGGRLVVMSPNGEGHEDVSDPWRDQLVIYKSQHPGLVEKVTTQAWVLIRGGTQRIGDIGVYLRGERTGQARPARAPELMFEIVSRGRSSYRRDYVEKRAEYHEIGVLEYVIVDRWRASVTVLNHEPTGYAERVLTAADTYTSPRLPGLAVRLAEIL